jgi:arginyl-tRNA synthetase
VARPEDERVGRRLQVEFVSANPTGPLHVGHGRGAAYGASLASLLAFAGYEVTREYYVNDAGRQMDILAVSAWLRYLELFDEPLPFPPNAYQGGYVREMAEQIKQAHGDRYVHPAEAVLACVPETDDDRGPPRRPDPRRQGPARRRLGLCPWPCAVRAAGRLPRRPRGVRRAFRRLVLRAQPLRHRHGGARRREAGKVRPHLRPGRRQMVPASTAFGDEKDRVVQRDNGIYTYFASDIAYHLNKFERGFDKVIDVWGADHHGYIPRVKGALLPPPGADAERLDVTLVQFVSLFRDGQKASMSTRSGEYVTLRQLREEVGNDACRFFYMLRKCDQAWISTSTWPSRRATTTRCITSSTPMPASARCWRSGTASGGAGQGRPRAAAARARIRPVRAAGRVPRTGPGAARDYAPHALAFYLKDLAGDFHGWYNAERVLVDDAATREARLALALATRQVLQNGLSLLGVSQPVSM